MLSLPPAFNLSHDQTLQFNLLFANIKRQAFLLDFNFGSFIVYVMYLLAIIDILKISAHRVNELTLSIFALLKISN